MSDKAHARQPWRTAIHRLLTRLFSTTDEHGVKIAALESRIAAIERGLNDMPSAIDRAFADAEKATDLASIVDVRMMQN